MLVQLPDPEPNLNAVAEFFKGIPGVTVFRNPDACNASAILSNFRIFESGKEKVPTQKLPKPTFPTDMPATKLQSVGEKRAMLASRSVEQTKNEREGNRKSG